MRPSTANTDTTSGSTHPVLEGLLSHQVRPHAAGQNELVSSPPDPLGASSCCAGGGSLQVGPEVDTPVVLPLCISALFLLRDRARAWSNGSREVQALSGCLRQGMLPLS